MDEEFVDVNINGSTSPTKKEYPVDWVNYQAAAFPRFQAPMGYGVPARTSTISKRERKKRTSKKKVAKHARRRNRR